MKNIKRRNQWWWGHIIVLDSKININSELTT